MKTAAASGALLVMTMALAACSKGNPACERVTAADAEAVLGQPVESAVAQGDACRYESVSKKGDVATFAVAIHEERSVTAAKEGFEGWKRKWGSGQVVEGLGDDAYLQAQGVAGPTIGTATLSARRGRTWLVLSVVVAEKKASYPALLELARRLVRDV